MGLHVSCYINVEKGTEDMHDFYVHVPYEPWKDRIKNLEDKRFYSGEELDDYIAYSYSTHTSFRRALCEIIGIPDYMLWLENPDPEIPFYELLFFSDCEGALDWDSVRELHTDFLTHYIKAKITLNSYFFNYYLKWLKLCSHHSKKCVLSFG